MSHELKPHTIVLSGGGSLGAVQVGMVKALAAAGLRVDAVIGSSVGAINGAGIASFSDLGEAAEVMERVWLSVEQRDVYEGTFRQSLSAVLGWDNHFAVPDALRDLLEEHLPHRRFEDLPRPYTAVAIDALSGREVPLNRGELVPAIMASAAIPTVFPPVEIAGRPLLDGGLGSATPLSLAVRQGARDVLLLTTGFTCNSGELPGDPLTMALHAVNLTQTRQLRADIDRHEAEARIVIVPPPCPIEAFAGSFRKVPELIERAEVRTREWLAQGGLGSSRVGHAERPPCARGCFAREPAEESEPAEAAY